MKKTTKIIKAMNEKKEVTVIFRDWMPTIPSPVFRITWKKRGEEYSYSSGEGFPEAKSKEDMLRYLLSVPDFGKMTEIREKKDSQIFIFDLNKE